MRTGFTVKHWISEVQLRTNIILNPHLTRQSEQHLSEVKLDASRKSGVTFEYCGVTSRVNTDPTCPSDTLPGDLDYGTPVGGKSATLDSLWAEAGVYKVLARSQNLLEIFANFWRR